MTKDATCCQQIASLAVNLRALLRAGFQCGVVAPLPLLAQQWAAISCGPAGACRSSLLAHGAACDRVLVPLRLCQSNGHGDCKQRYSESLQHVSFLPSFAVKFYVGNSLSTDIRTHRATDQWIDQSEAHLNECPLNQIGLSKKSCRSAGTGR
jgi:hypothetical protein